MPHHSVIQANFPEADRPSGLDPVLIPIEHICPAKNPLRTIVDETLISQLETSIRSWGILHPLLVRPSGDRFELVCGHRRFEVARRLKLGVVPVLIRPATDDESILIGIHENVVRSDFSPVEEARAYERLLDSGIFGTQEALASRLGLSQGRVSQILNLLNLPPEVLELFHTTRVIEGLSFRLNELHGRILRRVSDRDRQLELTHTALDEGLSAGELRRRIDAFPKRGYRVKIRWIRLDRGRFRETRRGLCIELETHRIQEQLEELERLKGILMEQASGGGTMEAEGNRP